jgi:hypothetical protein
MKKKLEADLVSIAHRILKQKNRQELDQLLQETLKLYEKLSVLKFVEDHFGGAEPTIGRASAIFELEDISGLKETEHVKGNEQEAKEDEARAKKKEDNENKSGEGVDIDADGEAPVSETEKEALEEQSDETAEPENTKKTDDKKQAEVEEKPVINNEADAPKQDKENENGEGVATEPEAEEAPVSDLEKQETEKSGEELKNDTPTQPAPGNEEIKEPTEDKPKVEEQPEPEAPKPETPVSSEEEAPMQDKENESGEGVATTPEEVPVSEEEKVYTEKEADKTPSQIADVFNFDKQSETAVKQKEISFEDFHDYKEPEFVKKGASWPIDFESPNKKEEDQPKVEWNAAPKQEEAKPAFNWDELKPTETKEETKQDTRDWREWEPAKSAEPEKPKAPEQPRYEAPKAEAPKSLNDGFTKSIALGLNDRIAFEKNLFSGSGEDLNRVLSQLNTFNNFSEAKNFIEDLVKPDYNNWAGKEEYEERFMVLVEKKFS